MVDENDYVHPPHPPRLREHVGMIKWSRDGKGDWVTETITGQYAGGDSRRWVIRLYSGIELEYDLETWSPYQPHF
jgi:hypothetical protein